MGTIVALPRRPGRRLTNDGRACFGLLPQGYGYGVRFLYACGFSDGTTKIGMTSSPRKRAVEHWRGKHRSLLWFHLFGPTFDRCTAAQAEQAAVHLASVFGQRLGQTEEFLGLSKPQVLTYVRDVLTVAQRWAEVA